MSETAVFLNVTPPKGATPPAELTSETVRDISRADVGRLTRA